MLFNVYTKTHVDLWRICTSFCEIAPALSVNHIRLVILISWKTNVNYELRVVQCKLWHNHDMWSSRIEKIHLPSLFPFGMSEMLGGLYKPKLYLVLMRSLFLISSSASAAPSAHANMKMNLCYVTWYEILKYSKRTVPLTLELLWTLQEDKAIEDRWVAFPETPESMRWSAYNMIMRRKKGYNVFSGFEKRTKKKIQRHLKKFENLLLSLTRPSDPKIFCTHTKINGIFSESREHLAVLCRNASDGVSSTDQNNPARYYQNVETELKESSKRILQDTARRIQLNLTKLVHIP